MTVVPIPPKNIQGRIRGIGDDVERERTLPQVKNAVVDQGYNKYVDGQAIPAVRVRVGLQADGTYDVRTYDSGGVLIQSLNSIIAGVGADASTTVKGISKLSSPPVSPTNPIAVGDNDPRMTDARTPTSHAASHKLGGGDAIRLDEFALPTAAVPMNTQKFTGLAAGSANGDSLRYEQLFTTGNVTLLGSLTVKNAKIADWAGGGTYGAFGNQALIGTAGSYAIMQGDGTADNSTYINAKTGGSILFRNNNVDVATMDASGFALATGVQLSIPQDAALGTHVVRLSQMQAAVGSMSLARPAARLSSPARNSDNTATITTATDTLLRWNAEAYDNDSMHDLTTNPSRITMQSGGNVHIEALVNFTAATGTGFSYAFISKNGSLLAIGPVLQWNNSASYSMALPVSCQDQCVPGDYYEVSIQHSTGSNKSIAAGRFSVQWIGGTGVAWSNAGARAINTGAQAIANVTYTAVTFAAETFDMDGMHSTVSNTDRLTCTVAGTYEVSAGVSFSNASAAGGRLIRILKNGSDVIAQDVRPSASTSFFTSCEVSTKIQLNVGDYLQVFVYQDSGISLNLVTFTSTGGSVPETHFEAVRVGYQTNPSTMPAAKLRRNAAGNTAATAGWINIPALDTSVYDYHNGTAQVDTTNGRIYARQKGIYRITANLGIAATHAGQKGIAIFINGVLAVPANGMAYHFTDDTSQVYVNITGECELNVGDYVSIGYHNPAAVARPLDTDYTSLTMSMVRAT